MKPNIVLIVTDDQTINTINSQGNGDIFTPNLDNLCKDGIFYDNCHIHGGTSGAICMPSRAVLHTSQNMFDLKEAGNWIPKEHPLLGEELQKLGYQTFFTGKWHNGVDAFNRSFTKGDNIFFGGMWDHYNVPTNSYDPTGAYDNKVKFVTNFFNSNKTEEMITNKFNPGIHSTNVVTGSAIECIENHDFNNPLFLNVAYLAPHDPRVVPEQFLQMYEDKHISLPANFDINHPFDFGQEVERDEVIAPKPLNEEWYLNELKSYYAMISHLDCEVGNIIDKLKACNQYDNSIIIFTSDNGLAIGSHGLMGKQNLYEESIRVPFILKNVNQQYANTVRHQLITLQDIFPTLIEMVGGEEPESLKGKSIVPTINSVDEVVHEHLYLAFTHYIRGIKCGDYKLIKYRHKDGEEHHQLFNIASDPGELNDLYNAIGAGKIKNELEAKLRLEKEVSENEQNEFTKTFWAKC